MDSTGRTARAFRRPSGSDDRSRHHALAVVLVTTGWIVTSTAAAEHLTYRVLEEATDA